MSTDSSTLRFVRPAQMVLFANVLCCPPLGQSTVIPHGQSEVKFIVLIESSVSFPEQPWEAVVWHNGRSGETWEGLSLQEVDEQPLAVNSEKRPKVYRRYFSSTLKVQTQSATVEFTIKYRTAPTQSWNWVNDQTNLVNGVLHLQTSSLPKYLGECIANLSKSFKVETVNSEVPETHLWVLKLAIEAAGKESRYLNEKLGTPINFARWFALVRIWTPWLAPRHGKSFFKITEDAVTCSFLRQDGLHFVLLAVSAIDDIVTVFQDDEMGGLVVSGRNDGTESADATVIAAIGYTQEKALAACMYHARRLITGVEVQSGEMQKELQAAEDNPPRAEWMESWYDGISFCTWNSLGQNLTEQKIFDALDDLGNNNIKVANLIIDDNWQSLDNEGAGQFERGWYEFDANKKGFPKGLANTVTEIRNRYPSIQHVAVWHALLGYWGGVSPDGEIAKRYKTRVVHKAPIRTPGGWTQPSETLTVVDEPDVQRMYNDFYTFLSRCGIDAVKTDAQFFLDLFTEAEDRRRLAKAYQDSWSINCLRYFQSKVISCMSQSPQILFHSQLPTNKPRLMVRNSDDFFPEIPGSHPWHIFSNAYTALFTRHLNVLPDWDMFQTYHEYSSFHAAGRCVSGGPIYFTDEPGKHDVHLIKQMTALSIKDTTVILRPSNIGRTIQTGVYDAYEDERLLKVGTYHGSKGTGTGILGVFNVSPKALSEFVLLDEFPGVEPETEYLVRAHSTGEMTGPMKIDDALPLLSVSLPDKSSEILTAYPLFSVGAAREHVAALGLLGKMTGAAAILGFDARSEHGKLRMSTTLKALGTFGIYIASLADKSIEDNFLVMIQGKPVPVHTVSKAGDKLLEVDVERAWKEMALSSHWSNEVTVDVFMT